MLHSKSFFKNPKLHTNFNVFSHPRTFKSYHFFIKNTSSFASFQFHHPCYKKIQVLYGLKSNYNIKNTNIPSFLHLNFYEYHKTLSCFKLLPHCSSNSSMPSSFATVCIILKSSTHTLCNHALDKPLNT